MIIYLKFADTISETYREKLQTFSENILAQRITENRPPSIEFPGMNEGTFYSIEYLQDVYGYRYI